MKIVLNSPRMPLMSLLKRGIALAVIGFSCVSAVEASTVTYTTSGNFSAAILGGSYTETFDSQSVGTVTGPLSFSHDGFSYQAQSTYLGSPDAFYNASSGSDVWLSTENAMDVITFTMTSGNITAVGGNFFTTDASGNSLAQSVVATLNDGTTLTLDSTTPSSFVGFVSTIPITTLTVHAIQPQSGFAYPSVNNLIVGENSSVPEPSSFGWLPLVLTGIILFLRRRGFLLNPSRP